MEVRYRVAPFDDWGLVCLFGSGSSNFCPSGIGDREDRYGVCTCSLTRLVRSPVPVLTKVTGQVVHWTPGSDGETPPCKVSVGRWKRDGRGGVVRRPGPIHPEGGVGTSDRVGGKPMSGTHLSTLVGRGIPFKI